MVEDADEEPRDRPDRDHVAEGLEHLQRAALEAIGAARTMLEAAEAVVREPAALEAVVETMTAVAKEAVGTIVPVGRGSAGERSEATDRPAEDDSAGAGAVEHIDVR